MNNLAGRALQAGRVLLGLSQPQIAELASVSAGTISNVEAGEAGRESFDRVRDILKRNGVYVSCDDAIISVVLVRSQAPAAEPPSCKTELDEEHMTEVDLEHYKVARLVSPNGETFTREKFLQKYYAEFPGRAPKSILPADYADGNNPSVKRKPKFLERVGHDRSGEYRRTR
jgi:transcriptional regulator with XRE-family HTH domain